MLVLRAYNCSCSGILVTKIAAIKKLFDLSSLYSLAYFYFLSGMTNSVRYILTCSKEYKRKICFNFLEK